jgi:RNA polymerase sigma-70 factor (ECF subfamily)
VRRHRGRIFSVLMRLTRSRPDAENLCQEAFLKAYLSLERFEQRSSFSTWLYRIAVNLALNHAERHKRIVRWDDEVHEDMLRTEPPEEDFEQRDALERLRAAIDELPPRQKATVLLRDYEGLSFEEVAEALECPVGTAKANHFHAVRNLRKRLAGPDPAAEPRNLDRSRKAPGVGRS